MRIGRRIAFDIGKARIGVAVSDSHGILASPRDFVPRKSEDSETLDLLQIQISDCEPIEIYCGLPLNLKSQVTESTADAVHIAKQLQQTFHIPVRLIDERLTTRVASSSLQAAGKNTRNQKQSIDSAAAAVIL